MRASVLAHVRSAHACRDVMQPNVRCEAFAAVSATSALDYVANGTDRHAQAAQIAKRERRALPQLCWEVKIKIRQHGVHATAVHEALAMRIQFVGQLRRRC